MIALSAVLRTAALGQKSLWADELLSIGHAQEIHDIPSFLTSHQGDAHPPLYFLLLKVWSYGGSSEAYLRLLSALFGVLAVAAVYYLAREITTERGALFAAFLMSVSPLQVLYDRELRMYSLFTLLSTLSILYFVRAVKSGSNRDWQLYAMITMLNTYTHYHAFFVVFSAWVYFLASNLPQRRKFLYAQAAVFVAYLPWLPTFLLHLKLSVLGGEPTRFPIAAGDWMRPFYLCYAFSLGQTVLPWNLAVTVPAACVFAAILFQGIKDLARNRPAALLMTCFLLVPLLLAQLVSDSVPRYMIFLSPLFLITLGMGWDAFPTRAIKIAIMLVVTGVLGIALKNYYMNQQFHVLATVDPWREVGAHLRDQVKNDDAFFNVGSAPINYYSGFHEAVLTDDALQVIQSAIAHHPPRRIWLVVSNPQYKDVIDRTTRWMSQHYRLLSVQRFLHDADFQQKARFFHKNFLEYRIQIYCFVPPQPSDAPPLKSDYHNVP